MKKPWLFPMNAGFFTTTRWWVVCNKQMRHKFRRRGWPAGEWSGRLSLLPSLMNKERRQ